MANITDKQKANLKPLTSKKAREIGSKGGKKSVEVRRARKTLKEELIALLSTGDTQNKISLALINQALTGDVSAFKKIEETIGEKPVETTINVETSYEDYIKRVEGDEY